MRPHALLACLQACTGVDVQHGMAYMPCMHLMPAKCLGGLLYLFLVLCLGSLLCLSHTVQPLASGPADSKGLCML